jgi:hypothetical protein
MIFPVATKKPVSRWASALAVLMASLALQPPLAAFDAITDVPVVGRSPDDLDGGKTPARTTKDGVAKRAVSVPKHLWEPGQSLTICFLSGTTIARQRVIELSADWTRYANLRFDFGDPAAPRTCSGTNIEDIKIDFAKDVGGHWSFIGRVSQQRSRSMNFAGYGEDALPDKATLQRFRRTVLHEFGHALGLKHEHQSPKSVCEDEIDFEAAYKHYEQRERWTKERVDRDLRRVPAAGHETSDYDPLSIMHYRFPLEILKRGALSPCWIAASTELSAKDKETIARLYPGRAPDAPVAKVVPPVQPPAPALPPPVAQRPAVPIQAPSAAGTGGDNKVR